MANLISYRAYARHRGVTLHAVQKAIAAGRITARKDAKGKPGIDPAEADTQWEANRSQPSPEQEASTQPPPVESSAHAASPQGLAAARTVTETYKARLARLEFEERSGKLVSAATVTAETYRRARQLRNRILGVPARVSARLTAMSDEREILQLLDDALRRALQEESDSG